MGEMMQVVGSTSLFLLVSTRHRRDQVRLAILANMSAHAWREACRLNAPMHSCNPHPSTSSGTGHRFSREPLSRLAAIAVAVRIGWRRTILHDDRLR